MVYNTQEPLVPFLVAHELQSLEWMKEEIVKLENELTYWRARRRQLLNRAAQRKQRRPEAHS